MRSSILTLILIAIVTSASAQWGDNYIKLSETITTKTKDITDFEKIDVSEDFEVHIRFSDTTEKVEIEANENLHDLIEVRKEGNTLRISTKSYSTSHGIGRKSGAKERLVAYITTKKLTEIKGDEDVVIVLKDKLYSDELTIDLNEDSSLEGFIEVQKLIVDLEEDSTLDIEGSTVSMQVTADEDSIIEGYGFIVEDLAIELNEDSEAKLTVNGDIDLVAKDDSYFYYRGAGNFTRKKLRGDSEVKHR